MMMEKHINSSKLPLRQWLLRTTNTQVTSRLAFWKKNERKMIIWKWCSRKGWLMIQRMFSTSARVSSVISCCPRMWARFSSCRSFSRMTGVGRLTSSASIMLPSRSIRRFWRPSVGGQLIRRARSISFTGEGSNASSIITIIRQC